MNHFLTPAEIESIKRDVTSLAAGAAGSDVILHWQVGSGNLNIYKRYDSYTSKTETVRAHVAVLSQEDVKRYQALDAQESYAWFIFGPDVDLQNDADGNPRSGLWFEVVGLGNFMPEEKQALAAHAHAILFSGSLMPGRDIFCKAKR